MQGEFSRFSSRSRSLGQDRAIIANAAGKFFLADGDAKDRISRSVLSNSDQAFLVRCGHGVVGEDTLGALSHELQIEARRAVAAPLDYLILVPTLRCNLACSYCQVSRANLDANGFDWSDETLLAVLAFLDQLETSSIKIEFQGGEPSLRPDLIQAVIERCQRFDEAQFVIC